MSWTPTCAIGEPSGPIENGTTYIVRPRIEPLNSSVSVSRISSGSRQLLVGPASSSSSEQMKVRSSTRATSFGFERARYEFGRFASESRSKVPASTSCRHSSSYSSAEPSHQCTVFRLGQLGHLLDPGEQLLVGGWRGRWLASRARGSPYLRRMRQISLSLGAP